MKKRISVALIIVFVFNTILYGVTPVQSNEDWKLNFDDSPLMCKIIDDKIGIVSTKSSLNGIDLQTGQKIWTIDDWYCKSTQHLGLIPNTKMAFALKAVKNEIRNSMSGGTVVYKHNEICMIDVEQGTTIWAKDTLAFLSCVGFSLLPRGDALLLTIRDEENDFWKMAVDIASGDVIWENRDFFGDKKPKTFISPGADKMIDGNQPPLYDTDSTMITIYQKNELRKWNLLTGEMIWQSDLMTKNVPLVTEGITPIMLSPDRTEIWVPCKKGLQTVATSDGSIKWNEMVKLPGLVTQLIPTETELFIIGGPNLEGKGGRPFITCVNRATGAREWKDDFKKLKPLKTSPVLLEGDSLIVYSDKKIFTVALADGSYHEAAKDLKFEGKETPKYFGKRDGNYILISGQNMMMLDPSYNIIYHSYYKAPGTSFLLKALAFTASVAISTVSAMYFSVPIYSGGGNTWYVFPTFYFGHPKYGHSTSTEDYMFVLSKVDDQSGGKSQEDWGIKKISKANGRVDAQVMLGEKNPEYDISPTNNAIMYLSKENTVAFRTL